VIVQKDRPQDTYIRILYKINEQYSKINVGEDLQEAISHYNSKDFTKSGLKELERVCRNEWKKILILLCDNLIKKLESKKKHKEILVSELKKLKSLKETINRNNISLSGYEKYFDKNYDELKDKIDSELSRGKWDLIRFWIGLGIGFILGIIGSFLVGRFS
jgi:hypothetical protein